MITDLERAKRRGVKVYEYDGPNDPLDKYSVVIGEDVFAMSDQPCRPYGFDQYVGTTDKLTNLGIEIPLEQCGDGLLAGIAGRLDNEEEWIAAVQEASYD